MSYDLPSSLKIKQYVHSLGLNPDNVYYQQVVCNNISESQAEWSIISPNRNALLLANAHVYWTLNLIKYNDTTPGAENITTAQFASSFKPYLPFHNATSNLQITINNGSVNYSQPRRFQEVLNMMFAGREDAKRIYGRCGGAPPNMDGIQAPGAAASALNYASWGLEDKQLINNELRFMDNARRNTVGGNLPDGAITGRNNINVKSFEPILGSPFNPFMGIKKKLPENCWFAKMSDTIPHVSRMEIKYNFQNLVPSAVFLRYAATANAAHGIQWRFGDLSATLHLWWYNPPMKMDIPRELSLQSWSVREYITDVGTVNNFAIFNVSSDLIQLHSVPTLIVIHAQIDKDSANYIAGYLQVDTDGNGTGAAAFADAENSLDSFMEIDDFQLILGDRPQVISTAFTQEELYELTVKNSKWEDFPYSFEMWRGRVARANAAADTILPNGCKMFLALTPGDLSEKFGPGVQAPTSLQFQMSLTANNGIDYLSGGNASYKLYTHIFYGNAHLKLTSDSSQFSEVSVPIDSQAVAMGAGLAGMSRAREYVRRS